MRFHRTRFLPITAAGAAAVTILAACSSGSSSSSSSQSNKKPITIGVSVSLTGDFSADGQAFQRGYNLWASDVNKRSEEHTSELQSRLHLVCRLLLEKKHKHTPPPPCAH